MACFALSVRRMGKMVSLNPVADLVPPGSSNIKRRISINLIKPDLQGLLLNRANRGQAWALIVRKEKITQPTQRFSCDM